MDEMMPPPDQGMMYDPYMMPPMGRRNYFGQSIDSATGFKYRVDSVEIVDRIMQQLRGMVGKDSKGKPIYDERAKQMNEDGLANFHFMLNGIVHKNVVLSAYPNEERINRQMKAILKQAIIPKIGLMRKEWEIKNPDFVLEVVENSIYATMLRANEALEAGLSAKSHQVMENISSTSSTQDGGGGFLARLFSMGKVRQ